MKNKGKLAVSVCAGVMFLLHIALLKKVDVAAIGPEGTSVGFSKLNKLIHKMFGESLTVYKITEVLGVAALAVAGIFGIMGLMQLIKRKNLYKVDPEILILGGIYVVLGFLYIVFEKVEINYRPVIMPGDEHVEASFPSSHTMLACVVLGTAMPLVGKYAKNRIQRSIFEVACLFLMTGLVLGRLISGVHWFTDIVGGVLISLCLIFLYYFLIDNFGSKEETE
jgi:undecaprenyl-diphosphatase